MSQASHENLNTIWFEGEMLPKWAQLLDAAARMCPVPEETRNWFTRLTNATGVDDARAVLANANALRQALDTTKETVLTELRTKADDTQAERVFAAWRYALETIIQQAASKKTCSWKVEGPDDGGAAGEGEGGVTLRRV